MSPEACSTSCTGVYLSGAVSTSSAGSVSPARATGRDGDDGDGGKGDDEGETAGGIA
ncbi:hypothetical protein [Streptomyces sp. NPDC056165]|uniref:hypothetical protein n=1 Tax=Streptomyces sp. NPDC056165 TaxID=3345733 RepID=UPI0035D58850